MFARATHAKTVACSPNVAQVVALSGERDVRSEARHPLHEERLDAMDQGRGPD